jgi:two-component system, NarL family, nitrate/nitrite response regulator NarL
VGDGEARLAPHQGSPTLVLISGQRLLAETLAAQLAADGAWAVEVLDAAHPGLLVACRALHPALFVLDVDDHLLPGLATLSQLVTAFPDTGVLMLGELPADAVAEAINRGARGCLTYAAALSDVREAVTAIVSGRTVVPAVELTQIIEGMHHPAGAPSPPQHGLSCRELEVLRMLTAGESTEAMADAMGISVPTVRKHVQNVLGKLGVHTKLQAAAYAVRRGII